MHASVCKSLLFMPSAPIMRALWRLQRAVLHSYAADSGLAGTSADCALIALFCSLYLPLFLRFGKYPSCPTTIYIS